MLNCPHLGTAWAFGGMERRLSVGGGLATGGRLVAPALPEGRLPRMAACPSRRVRSPTDYARTSGSGLDSGSASAADPQQALCWDSAAGSAAGSDSASELEPQHVFCGASASSVEPQQGSGSAWASAPQQASGSASAEDPQQVSGSASASEPQQVSATNSSAVPQQAGSDAGAGSGSGATTGAGLGSAVADTLFPYFSSYHSTMLFFVMFDSPVVFYCFIAVCPWMFSYNLFIGLPP